MKKIILLLSIILFSCGNPQNEKITNDVENHFAKLADSCQVVTSNLYNQETATIGQAILSNGTLTTNANNAVSEYISLDSSTTYSYSGAKGLGNYNYLYDSNYNPVRSLGALVNGSFTTNATTEIYARFTVGNAPFGTGSDIGLLQLNKGVTADYLQPYGEERCQNWTNDLPENAVILLIDAGQSNALGACSNKTGGSFKSERQMTNIIQVWNKTNNTFQNQNIDGKGNHGIDLTLQKLVYEWARPFYYVNIAVSNTVISKHLQGGSVDLTAYPAVKNSINTLLSQNKRVYVYFRFVQGEGDSSTQLLVNTYLSKQNNYLALWRSRLGNIPFIVSGINVHGTTLEQSLDLQINQIKQDAATSSDYTFYSTTSFDLDINNQDHRSYFGYFEEANMVWDLLNQIQPIEIINPIN